MSEPVITIYANCQKGKNDIKVYYSKQLTLMLQAIYFSVYAKRIRKKRNQGNYINYRLRGV